MPSAGVLQSEEDGIRIPLCRRLEWKRACRINHLVETKDILKAEKLSGLLNRCKFGCERSTSPDTPHICHINIRTYSTVCLFTKRQMQGSGPKWNVRG